MNITCGKCRASYRLDLMMFMGARGMSVRCRRCGESILVLNPEEIASDMSVPFSVASEGDHPGNGNTDPAVSPAEEEYSPPPEVEPDPPVEEQARISQKNREEEEFSVLEVEQVPPVEEQARILRRKWDEGEFSVAEAGKNSPPGSVQTFDSIIILPHSLPEDLRRRTFIWPSIVTSVLLFVLLVGGTVSLVFPLLGKQVLADIGKRIEEVSTIFRS